MIGNHLEPFKFWCQKVLPNVYDDSLSYYEYLCKLNEYLNDVIEQINTLTDNMSDYETDLSQKWLDYKTNLTEQWTTYKNYIDNYFNNLNVQTEINNKLDAMATDGTLSALIEPFVGTDIQTAVTNWLTEHVDPVGSAVTVDNTLTISGSAADAKAVGDRALLCDGYIDTNTDLNNILHNGFYTVLPNRTLTHAPDNYATSSALLIVYATVNNSETAQLTQIYINYSKNTIHQRIKGANDTFGNWKLINYDNLGFSSFGYINTNTDLNDLNNEGYYTILSNVTLSNAPSDYNASTCCLLIFPATDNSAVAQITQVFINWSVGTIWSRVRQVTTGTWWDWRLMTKSYFTTKSYVDNNTNLNNLITEGYYNILPNRTLTNAPSDYASSSSIIIVYPVSNDSSSTAMISQMYINYSKNTIWFRFREATTTTWATWKQLNAFNDNKGFCAKGYIDNNTDLNTIYDEGFYTVLPNRTLVNAPSDYSGCNSFVATYPTVSTSTVAQINQMYFNWSLNTIWYRFKQVNGSWSVWKQINPKQNFLHNGNVLTETNFSSSYTANNYGTNLDILIYNVAHYSKFTGHKIGDSGYENYLTNFKKVLQHINPDVCFIEEDARYIDTYETKASENYLYNNLLPVSTGYSETTIKSKIAFDVVQDDHTSETRPSIYAVWNSLGRKKVLVYCAHLVPSSGAETTRLAELEHIFSVINSVNPDAFIICGDFNTLSATDRSNLISVCNTNNARYGNGGWLGWIDTTQGYSTDNIIVSNNVFINKFEVMSELYEELFSDHNPIAVNITIKDA